MTTRQFIQLLFMFFVASMGITINYLRGKHKIKAARTFVVIALIVSAAYIYMLTADILWALGMALVVLLIHFGVWFNKKV